MNEKKKFKIVSVNKTRHILSSIGNYVYNKLKSNKVLITPPQGGFYIMPEFLNSKFQTSQEMCDDILNWSCFITWLRFWI